MTDKLTFRKIDNAYGVVIPEDILNKLHVVEGDLLLISKKGNGYEISAKNDEFSRQMAIADNITKRYHNALTELAKY